MGLSLKMSSNYKKGKVPRLIEVTENIKTNSQIYKHNKFVILKCYKGICNDLQQ